METISEEATLESLAADVRAKRISMNEAALRYQRAMPPDVALATRIELQRAQMDEVGVFNQARFRLLEFAEKPTA